jgi:putative hemolysin
MQDRLLFSYASAEDPLLRRLTVRTIERLTGQPRLKRIYLDNVRRPHAGESFWAAAVRRLQLRVDYDPERLAAIPAHGPVVVAANHPFGVLDGLVIGYLIAKVRTDFKVLTHNALYRASEIRPYLLPIDFAGTDAATETNLRSRSNALAWLRQGGLLVVFPAGEVSTAAGPFVRRALDSPWKPFTARAIVQTRSTVVPVFFGGQNSRLFQIASHVSQTLRTSLLFHEVRNKLGRSVEVRIGRPLPYDEVAHLTDRHELIEHLRSRTYALATPLTLEGPGEPRRPPNGRRLRLPRRRRKDRPGPVAPGETPAAGSLGASGQIDQRQQ